MDDATTGHRVVVVGSGYHDVHEVVADLDETVAWPVDGEVDRELAANRVANPRCLCLVYLDEPRGGTTMDEPFLAYLQRAYPTLPLVAVGRVPDTVDLSAFTAAEHCDRSAGVGEAVEALVETRIESRDERGRPDQPTGKWPNVDESEVRAMLDRGLDEEQLGRLLHKSRLLDAIFAEIPLHLYVKDRAARHLYISDRIFGEREQQFDERSDPDISLPLVSDYHDWRAYEDDRYVIDTASEILDKEEYVQEKGKWNLTSKVPWRDPDGNVVGLIGLSIPITERKRREQEVREQKEQLERFADVVAHDLRNPIQLAQQWLTLYREERQPEDLQRIEETLEEISDIVDDVLALARERQGGVEPRVVDVGEVVDAAWTLVDSGDATLRTTKEVTDSRLRADRARLLRVFINLFSNAVEHGGADVTVRVGRLDDGFYVADDGEGIPETERPRVVKSGHTSLENGTGFGLAIVSRAVESHDWDVTITDSEAGGARLEISGVEWVEE